MLRSFISEAVYRIFSSSFNNLEAHREKSDHKGLVNLGKVSQSRKAAPIWENALQYPLCQTGGMAVFFSLHGQPLRGKSLIPAQTESCTFLASTRAFMPEEESR
jgi:hypothetical protein